jgi:N-acetylmuramoyl-L-alanine amidase
MKFILNLFGLACLFFFHCSSPAISQQKNIAYDTTLIPVLRQILPLSISEMENLNESDRKNIECIAWNLYFEARGGTYQEKIAVAYVPINRTKTDRWSKNICENVFQYHISNGYKSYQFIWAGFNLSPNWFIEQETWKNIQIIAYKVYLNDLPDPSYGSVFFNHHSVGGGHNSTRIGSHLFFK